MECSKYLDTVGIALIHQLLANKIMQKADDPKSFIGSLRYTCIYIAPRKLDYCILFLSVIYIIISIKLGLCSQELEFCLFGNILGIGLGHNGTFFVKYPH